ncbi:hypothetical protein OG698_01270 [Streptomyces sp. NBC_01003]|uniref:hypothetical protein n=1 Tax=Streptomyces sp. NBC_01003 TaxID=2903714 RepID=UPI00386E4DB1|nr:hypothetical protein OG698_01270 [Streptomyces sp. NBC_01003]
MQDLLDARGRVHARRHREEQHGGHDARQRRSIALAEPPGAAQGGGDGLLGTRGDDQGLVVAGLGGVTEDHLAQVDAPVVDMGPVACDDRSDDRHHRTQCVGGILGARPALLQGFGIQGVLDEQQELALGLGVQEQRAGADVGLVGDLPGGDSSTPRSANSSRAAAVMRSSLRCLFRSRRPAGWGAGDVDQRDAAVSVRRGLPAHGDLRTVEITGVLPHRRALAQAGIGVHQGSRLRLVPVLPVGVDDLSELVMQLQQLRGLDRTDVGMPDCPPVVVPQQIPRTEG